MTGSPTWVAGTSLIESSPAVSPQGVPKQEAEGEAGRGPEPRPGTNMGCRHSHPWPDTCHHLCSLSFNSGRGSFLPAQRSDDRYHPFYLPLPQPASFKMKPKSSSHSARGGQKQWGWVWLCLAVPHTTHKDRNFIQPRRVNL